MNQLSLFDQAEREMPPDHVAGPETFVDDIKAFNRFGERTVRETVDGIPYLINEFWTSQQRQSHSIHEVSYRACFKAQLPEFFIERLTKPGDVVFDPFMGRGTTPVQAALMGRKAYGNDISPISILLARPRLYPVKQHDVYKALETVDWSRGRIEREDLLAFYHPKTLKDLEALRLWLVERVPIGADKVDRVADWIRMVAINRLSGHSPGFFSGRTMPPNLAVSVKAQEKLNEKMGIKPPKRDVKWVILRKSEKLLRDIKPRDDVETRDMALSSLHTGPAWDVPGIKNSSVDLTVTSPPFLDIVQYAADNWLRCWFAGIDPDSVAIDMHRTEDAWTEMVHRVLAEQARILRPGGHVAFEVGEVRNGTVLLEKLVCRAAEGLAFDLLGVMVNSQEFTKTANCWGVENGSKGTNTNRIVLLRRH